jgi:hypothetical protein
MNVTDEHLNDSKSRRNGWIQEFKIKVEYEDARVVRKKIVPKGHAGGG